MTLPPEAAEVIAGERRWCVIEGDNRLVLPTLPDKSVAHIFSDAPYSEHVHGKQRRILRGSGGDGAARTDGSIGKVCVAALGFDALTAEHRDFCGEQFPRIARRWVLEFCDCESAADWRGALTTGGARHIRIGAWIKLNGQPQLSGDRPAVGFEAIEIAHGTGERCRWNGGGMPAVWAFPIATDRQGRGDRVHTTQKPIDLLLKHVEQFTDEGDLVLDPFCGSATSGVACLRMGRRYIGIELDPAYAAIARERLEAESQGLTLRAARAGQTAMFSAEELQPKTRPPVEREPWGQTAEPEPEPMSDEEAEAWDAMEREASEEADESASQERVEVAT